MGREGRVKGGGAKGVVVGVVGKNILQTDTQTHKQMDTQTHEHTDTRTDELRDIVTS